MTGYTNSHLVPFLDQPPSNDFILRDHQLAELFQPIDSSDRVSLVDPFSNTEDPIRRFIIGSRNPRPNPKVPIPRISTPVSWTNGARVSQACEACRGPKIKCSGHRPACHRCEEIGIVCQYGDRKREKTDKQLNNLNAQIGLLENLLRDLYPRLDTQSAEYVDRTLGKVSLPPLPSLPRQAKLAYLIFKTILSMLSNNTQISRHDRGPPTVPGLPEACKVAEDPLVTVDYTQEDFNRLGEMQALGFVGEHSEMAWLYRLKNALEQSPAKPSTSQEDFCRLSVTSMDFYQNDCDMAIRDEVGLLERPSQGMADQLISTYFQIIHPSFPIIGRRTFVAQFRSYYSDPTTRPGKQWLAVLNFMFAIAAMHLSPVKKLTECKECPHLVYFSRAWILSMDKASLRDHPSLQQVQVEGLAAFYLLASGQVNRSWKCCGIAMRSALAMGLNLRSESQSVAPLSKEIRYRVWWALYVLDTSLSVMTGRPPGISGIFCTTPLPIPFEEGHLQSDYVLKYIIDKGARSCLLETLLSTGGGNMSKHSLTESVPPGYPASNKQSPKENTAPVMAELPQPNNSLCFLYAVSLTILTREAIDKLYAPGAAHKPWFEIEIVISSLNDKADSWLDSLPAPYNFKAISKAGPLRRQCASLAFHFYSTKLFITQPCLRRLIYRSPVSDVRMDASDSMTAICIQAACQLLDLLPDEPDLTWLYGVCPWWCALHYFMQSITIILTGSFIRTRLGTIDTISIMPKLRKATVWLKEMSKINVSARKAWL
ncbi:uncharacterized protein N7482_010760, partial [Penicillium canariense]